MHGKFSKIILLFSKDSDQTGHQHSIISLCCGHKETGILSSTIIGEKSDLTADAQADLSFSLDAGLISLLIK